MNESPSEKQIVHVIFSGPVQGVGFRLTAQMFARKHGINGTVKNLSDGRVEMVAEGHKGDVQHLIERLNDYFQLNDEQSSIDSTGHSESLHHDDFRIIY